VVWEITAGVQPQVHALRITRRQGASLGADDRGVYRRVRQLARLRVREVTVIGGEAFLRRDWLTIIQPSAITACTQHAERRAGADEDRIRAAKAGGAALVRLSLDGYRNCTTSCAA